jgi:hypothetical protein
LRPGETERLDATDTVVSGTGGTLTNEVVVTGTAVGGGDECTATDSVTVTIRPGPPIGGKGKGKGGKNKGGGFVVGNPGFTNRRLSGTGIIGNEGFFVDDSGSGK